MVQTPRAFLGLALLFGCAATQTPRLAPIGDYERRVTCSGPGQQDFNQGLLWTYGFNHDEAVRSFRRVLRSDPDSAMAWWGIAFALGPNLNAPLEEPKQARTAYDAVQEALALLGGASELERDLVRALAKRYSREMPEDRASLDKEYADAMARLWQKYPEDPDVGTLYADALMNLSPGEYWTRKRRPKPNTAKIVSTLEQVLKLNPDHPGANHLYIHALEASRFVYKALSAAERLPRLVPGSGHLVHMPAHVYIRLGRYAEAVEANEAAVRVDNAYFDKVGPQGVYEFYRAHNYHFLTYALMFEGRKQEALRAARDLVRVLPEQARRDTPEFVDGFLAVPWHVMVRFGLWEDILAEPKPAARFPIATALWHYARGVALANVGRFPEAREQQQAFDVAAAKVGAEARIGINPAPPVLVVARYMLAGEVQFLSGKRPQGLDSLRKAVEAEDALRYDEPSPWMQPVRHALGALLMENDQFGEAEMVYREDLQKHPHNGWSLHGLKECLRYRKAFDEMVRTDSRFKQSWQRSDIKIQSSCFCRSKKK